MSHAYESAATQILDCLHRAEQDLVGSSVQRFNGEAGEVKALKLDEHHGLCFTLDNWSFYPVSTIRIKS